MIRYYLVGTDTNNFPSRWPQFLAPFRTPQYLGTVVYVAQTNNLPIFHWFVQNPALANTFTGTRCSIMYLDQFYDNARAGLHGQSTSGGDFPNKPYGFDFNNGAKFLYDTNQARVAGMDLLQVYSDKSHMRHMLASLAAVQLTGTNQARYVYDNVNIPEVVDYLAAMIITGDVDCCHKNYYFYRDTEGTGEWQMFPWDLDLSFGRVWSTPLTYWDELVHPDTGLYVGGGNSLPNVIFGRPELKQMYLRRLRTLMDTI